MTPHDSLTAAPSRRRALPAAAALGSLFVFALSGNVLPAAVLRAAPDLGLQPATLAQAATAQFLAFFAAAVAGGIAADRFGKKPVFLSAISLLAAGAVVWTFARGMGSATVGAGLMGLGGGVMESMGCALLADLFPERRKLLLNLSQVIYCAGAIGWPLVMGSLLPLGVSWRLFFFGIALLALILVVVFAASHIPPPEPHEQITLTRLGRLVRCPTFLVPCLALFCYVLPESCVVMYANLYLRQHCGAPENWAIYSISAVWLTMAVGRALCAMLPERMSYERTLAVLFGASAVAMAAQGLAPGWMAPFVLFAIAGLAFAGTWPLIVALAAARNPGHSGTVVGLTVATGALGVAAAPPLMNALLAAIPSSLAFVLVAMPMVAGGILVLLPAGRSRAEMESNAQNGGNP